jgi:hypothetical protein
MKTLTCSCSSGLLCTACVPAGLELLIQLKLSLVWASAPPELRERRGAEAHLAALAQQN